MFLTVRGIPQIQVSEINGTEIQVKDGETFEASNILGQGYLNNYPQYFRTHSTAQTAPKEEVLTVAQLKDKITELGAEPVVGNKSDLEAQYADLLNPKEEADEPNTVDQLKEAIIALGAEPVEGLKADLEAQYDELVKAQEANK